MQSKISIVLLILIILYSCTLENKKQIIKKIDILNSNEINKNKVEKKKYSKS